MAVFKCKMCGGTLEINQNESVAVCEYCGTKQTLPKLDDDRRVNLYDRANHFRRNNEFDKAAGIYEQILNEDTNDAEAYWSLVLCRYGIEYVEDPASRKRIPTVNRMQYTSIFDDDNYKLALQHADGEQRAVYEEEAKAINELQKGILAISEKEAPFDVFICYKETDSNGRRTQDSVLANDLYHQLTQEGFKVFFSRITLEDKLGTAYEPYIFAALNSAKVMVVLGTKPEYFNAVWVRNEWSRYLALIKSGAKKALIPAYKDMDPYDLPEEFSHLQAQDMSKLGFMQDLIRGIKKMAQPEIPKATAQESTGRPVAGGSNTASLLKRAYIFLEDGDWDSADQYCEKVLDIEPENAMGYLGKLMAELHVHRQEQLADCEKPFDDRSNYQKAVRYADDKLAEELKGYTSYIVERNEKTRIETIYSNALKMMSHADEQEAFEKAAGLFESIKEYQHSTALAEECHKRGETCRKNGIYEAAKKQMNYVDGINQKGNAEVLVYITTIELLESIAGWRNADELAVCCREKIDEIEKTRKRRVKRKKRIAILTSLVTITGIVIFLCGKAVCESVYERGMNYYREDDYINAYNMFRLIKWYKNSETYMYRSQYSYGHDLWDEGKYEEAIAAFEKASGYGDSTTYIYRLERELQYSAALELMNAGKYDVAIVVFESIDNYFGDRPSISDQVRNCEIALKYGEEYYYKVKDILAGDTYVFGSYEQDNDETNGPEEIQWLIDSIALGEDGVELLLVSEYALDFLPYHSSLSDVTWESCSLRQWLNNTFINTAFDETERAMIMETEVPADSDAASVNATVDKIFLQSESSYFTCSYSKYVKAKAEAVRGVTSDENIIDSCWLRLSGDSSVFAPISVSGDNSSRRYRDFVFECKNVFADEIIDKLFGAGTSDFFDEFYEYFFDDEGVFDVWSFCDDTGVLLINGSDGPYSSGYNGVVPVLRICIEF